MKYLWIFCQNANMTTPPNKKTLITIQNHPTNMCQLKRYTAECQNNNLFGILYVTKYQNWKKIYDIVFWLIKEFYYVQSVFEKQSHNYKSYNG